MTDIFFTAELNFILLWMSVPGGEQTFTLVVGLACLLQQTQPMHHLDEVNFSVTRSFIVFCLPGTENDDPIVGVVTRSEHESS